MGDHDEWSQPRGGILPNGLLPNAGPLLDTLDSVRWLKAEERTAELIACIQPNQPSEERRNAVADYVQRLIKKCFPCQVLVFTFGSVPLKTYLPDGDIDLTAFSNNANLKDNWASEVRDMLETEEKNENAEFRVKEVQYIQAEVKIIKCLVENIVVDISFNQLGGLCTLCFLEEVDNLINQNHLFKRSIILIKAWCYYESRILGAHHGLISTYALETLVLYIFHVFNNSFAGPLEVLYRFLEFFSNFDWENFCVSLWGPVPISSLPDVTAEDPRKDSGELLLKKGFLDACSAVYAVIPVGQDSQGQTFVSKHFNVIDPLRVSNNLGRSVSKGNFFRIRSAFAFGAKKLARLLNCPQENLVAEVNQFFTNTWERHGSGIRPDAPGIDLLRLNLSVSDNLNIKVSSSGKKFKEFTGRESEFEDTRSRNSSRQHNNNNNSHNQSENTVKKNLNSNRGQKNLISGQLVNDIQRSPFARTRSSPELTDSYNELPSSQGRVSRAPESVKSHPSVDHHNRRKNVEPDVLPNQNHTSVDLNNNLSIGTQGMQQEEQDLVNIMASSGQLHGYNGQLHMPMSHLPFPFSPSFIRNFTGMVPANFPMMDPAFSGMQFPHGFVSPQLTHFFPGMNSNEDSIESGNEHFNTVELSSVDHDHDSWKEDVGSTSGVESENISLEDNKRQSNSVGLSYVPPPRRVGASGGLSRSQQKSQPKYNKEKRGPSRDKSDSISDENFSENSWEEKSTVNKSTKEKRGKKVVVSAESSSSSGYVKGKTMFESTPSQQSEDDDDRLAGPIILNPNSRQRIPEPSGNIPLTFYPTGPPVPFLTMLPFYNVPSQPNPSEPSTSNINMENDDLINYNHESDESLRGPASGEERKADILNSDFASHYKNLQFGRICQSPQQNGPMPAYHSSVMVPPMYLQGRVPWDGPGRPVHNMNMVTQLVNYGPRIVPVAPPVQSAPNRPNVYQRYVEELPRYRSGTGTYLPNPKVAVRDRHPSGSRRGNYNHDRTENEGTWTTNSKPRGSRNHNRNQNQTDKSSSRSDRLNSNDNRADRSMNSYRHDSFSTYQTQNGSLHPSSSQAGQVAPGHVNVNVGYGMYPGGPSSNGSAVPSMVMMYPYEHNSGFGLSSEQQLEFGSLGPVGFSGVNEQAQVSEGSRVRGTSEEHRLYGASVQRSSPDQPSSPPHHQRRV